MALTKIKADGLTADLIDETKLADNSIDSEHYNDGSIDAEHILDAQIVESKLATNAVTTNKIADGTISTNKIAVDTVDQTRLKVSNSPTNGQFLSAQSGNTGGLTWAAVPAGVGGATGLDVNDDVKIRLGTGNDLELYHAGSEPYSVIRQNDGPLYIQTDDTTNGISLGTYTDGETMARFIKNGAVKLYHNNSKKLETTATGVTVTGVVAATTLTGDGSALTGVSSSSADGCIWKNTLTISNAHTIAATEGAHSVGPITLNNTVTVNGRWVIS